MMPCAVCILDPKTAFEAAPAAAASVVRLSIPFSFLPQLSSPKFSVGEADDPMTSWSFGKEAEIFEYIFAGRVFLFFSNLICVCLLA
jgi:hypothetical protein